MASPGWGASPDSDASSSTSTGRRTSNTCQTHRRRATRVKGAHGRPIDAPSRRPAALAPGARPRARCNGSCGPAARCCMHVIRAGVAFSRTEPARAKDQRLDTRTGALLRPETRAASGSVDGGRRRHAGHMVPAQRSAPRRGQLTVERSSTIATAVPTLHRLTGSLAHRHWPVARQARASLRHMLGTEVLRRC